MTPECQAYKAALASCTHEDRRSSHYGYTTCFACMDAALPLRRSMEAADKRNRKAELDAMPRCMADGCKRRGTTRFPGGVLVCGVHKKNIIRQHAGMGVMGMLCGANLSREVLLAWAKIT